MISKYPVISENNKRYKVKIKKTKDNLLKLILYRKILFFDSPLEWSYLECGIKSFNNDYILETRKLIELYEYEKGIGGSTPSTITEFLEWDGNLKGGMK